MNLKKITLLFSALIALPALNAARSTLNPILVQKRKCVICRKTFTGFSWINHLKGQEKYFEYRYDYIDRKWHGSQRCCKRCKSPLCSKQHRLDHRKVCSKTGLKKK